MCLLINQPEGVSFSDEWLADFYQRNNDGFGYMYAEGNTLYYKKVVGDLAAVINTYKEVSGRAAALHFRMKTHGNIDMENTHPYPVLTSDDGYPIYLMHNGVLSSGNTSDLSKSDTWHYIKDVLRPLLVHKPEMFMEPAFQRLVEKDIGSGNKFLLMDAYGNTRVYNQGSGVEWEATPNKPKAWMSNTYAWSASKAGFGYRGGTTYSYESGGDWYSPGYTPKKPESKRTEAGVTFFAALKEAGYMKAWNKLNYSEVHPYYDDVGEVFFQWFVGEIKNKLLSEDEVIEEIKSVSGGQSDKYSKGETNAVARTIFKTLQDNGYHAAYQALKFSECTMFAARSGKKAIRAFLDKVENRKFTMDADIVDEVADVNAGITNPPAVVNSPMPDVWVRNQRVNEFFAILRELHFSHAYKALTYANLQDMFDYLGQTEFDAVLKQVEMSAFLEEEIMELVKQTLADKEHANELEAALN